MFNVRNYQQLRRWAINGVCFILSPRSLKNETLVEMTKWGALVKTTFASTFARLGVSVRGGWRRQATTFS